MAQKRVSTSFSAGIQRLQECSLFSARLLSKDADLLNDLLQNHQQAYVIAEMQHFLEAANIVDDASLKKALRQLRQRVILRTIYRDLNGLADLSEVLQTTTQLAETSLNTAAQCHQTWLEA
ncbi:MAG TPA: bifunctional glutamine synthetase adenylyltransferase/deadenyltransferase, partial [Methylotenera sp.]|nr:bifunctional glutamine synthetase adenylyltransferase/deadenyltransferase [Methylotenera sp.]